MGERVGIKCIKKGFFEIVILDSGGKEYYIKKCNYFLGSLWVGKW